LLTKLTSDLCRPPPVSKGAVSGERVAPSGWSRPASRPLAACPLAAHPPPRWAASRSVHREPDWQVSEMHDDIG
jgi:hypothetical protein